MLDTFLTLRTTLCCFGSKASIDGSARHVRYSSNRGTDWDKRADLNAIPHQGMLTWAVQFSA
jgi:hypothetical protein